MSLGQAHIRAVLVAAEPRKQHLMVLSPASLETHFGVLSPPQTWVMATTWQLQSKLGQIAQHHDKRSTERRNNLFKRQERVQEATDGDSQRNGKHHLS